MTKPVQNMICPQHKCERASEFFLSLITFVKTTTENKKAHNR